MKVRLLLANHAEVKGGMLYAMGIGWTQIGPKASPFAIAALIEVTWEETNRPYKISFDILDVDGQPFHVPTATGDKRFELGAEFNQGRPPDVPPGSPFLACIAMNIQAVQFQPGQQYVLRALVDGEVMDQTGFRVRPAEPPKRQLP
jgi:hypothetical protein